VPFGINAHDRLFHALILGQTGTGKSTLLRSMALQDAKIGQGFCLIDPHGDIAESLHQTLDVPHIYWNVSDPSSSYGYNPIPRAAKSLRPIIASGFVDTLRHQWADAWGPRMESLLRWGLLALLDQPSATIADLMPLYTDKGFRKAVIQNIEDVECLRFWTQEYPALSYKTAFDGVAPIANKLSALLSHPILRQALTAPQTPLRFRKIIDDGDILIVNLAKGQLGSGAANVMGGLTLTGLRNAAFSRQGVPEQQRKPYFVSVDEFHHFTSETTAESLSELRKYGLGLILAGQYLSQASTATQEAILGNVGTSIIFRLGIADTAKMRRYLQFPSEADLLNQPNHRAYCKLMIDGGQSKAFSMETRGP
jgi:hypothetical protein